MKLIGKRVLVTGGGRGIGAAIALAFAAEGADVCVTARTQSQIDEVAERIRALGRRGVATICDVADAGQAAAAVQTTCDSLGGLDILVNNAGGGELRVNVGEDDVDRWREVIEVNLLGTYYFSRAALPALKQSGGGSIINVGSGMGHQPRVGNSSYNTAKAGVWMLTRCLAMELWQDNIRVNELIPGPVYTELTASVFEAGQAQFAIEVPQRKKDPISFTTDETIREGMTADSISGMRSAFKKDGTVTAANASAINDGASALVIMSADKAAELGLSPLARITGYATGGVEPEWVMMAPEVSIKKASAKLGVKPTDFDLHEINEAFSAAACALTNVLELDSSKVNVNGGAVALGHPIGASGARVLTTLLYAMRDRGAKTGMASLCLGGGNAVSLTVESL